MDQVTAGFQIFLMEGLRWPLDSHFAWNGLRFRFVARIGRLEAVVVLRACINKGIVRQGNHGV